MPRPRQGASGRHGWAQLGIWLPFAVRLLPACAWLPPRQHRAWLAAQGLFALAVNSLLLTVW